MMKPVKSALAQKKVPQLVHEAVGSPHRSSQTPHSMDRLAITQGRSCRRGELLGAPLSHWPVVQLVQVRLDNGCVEG